MATVFTSILVEIFRNNLEFIFNILLFLKKSISPHKVYANYATSHLPCCAEILHLLHMDVTFVDTMWEILIGSEFQTDSHLHDV